MAEARGAVCITERRIAKHCARRCERKGDDARRPRRLEASKLATRESQLTVASGSTRLELPLNWRNMSESVSFPQTTRRMRFDELSIHLSTASRSWLTGPRVAQNALSFPLAANADEKLGEVTRRHLTHNQTQGMRLGTGQKSIEKVTYSARRRAARRVARRMDGDDGWSILLTFCTFGFR